MAPHLAPNLDGGGGRHGRRCRDPPVVVPLARDGPSGFVFRPARFWSSVFCHWRVYLSSWRRSWCRSWSGPGRGRPSSGGSRLAAGWLWVGFVLLNALSPLQVDSYLEFGLEPLSRLITWVGPRVAAMLRNAPTWFDFLLEEVLDSGSYALVCSVPQLLVALLGGWLARWLGISIRIETRRDQGSPTTLAESQPTTARTSMDLL